MREVCVLWSALRCEWSREQTLPEGPVQVSGARRRAQEEEIGAECTRDRNSAGGLPDSTEHMLEQKKKQKLHQQFAKNFFTLYSLYGFG